MKDERVNRYTNNVILRWLVILFVFIFIAVSVSFSCEHYYSLSQARSILYNAKVTRLAAYSVSLKYYGINKQFSDMTSPTGFAGSIADEITELSNCQGKIRLLTTDKFGYKLLEMSYIENGYTVHIVQKKDGEYKWTVVKEKFYIE